MKKVEFKRKCIECGDMFDSDNTNPQLFCPACSDNVCDVCGVVLSEKYVCQCGKKHGQSSGKIGLCSSCDAKGLKPIHRQNELWGILS